MPTSRVLARAVGDPLRYNIYIIETPLPVRDAIYIYIYTGCILQGVAPTRALLAAAAVVHRWFQCRLLCVPRQHSHCTETYTRTNAAPRGSDTGTGTHTYPSTRARVSHITCHDTSTSM